MFSKRPTPNSSIVRSFSLALIAAAALSACGGGSSGENAEQVPSAPPVVVPPPVVIPPVETPPPIVIPPIEAPPPVVTPPVLTPPVVIGGTACDTAIGPVLEVGPGKLYAKPSAAIAAAQPGSVIKIQAGEYRGDVTAWSKDNLTICGVGGRASLYADGKSSQGKAIWVIGGANTVIDSIAFHNTKVADANGAGIRMEHKTGDLRVINSGFYDNENGILTTGGPITLTVERSEFARNTDNKAAGQAHNIYAGAIDKLTVTASYFHEARYGSNVKSRAKESILENNYIMDGTTGEGSYLTDFSNGGKVLLKGNMLQKSNNAPNGVSIQFGAEGQRWPINTLEMINNTVVSMRTNPNTTFLRVAPWANSVNLEANIFASTSGLNKLISGTEFPLLSIVQTSNVAMRSDAFPGATNIAVPNFWPNAQSLPLTELQTLINNGYTYDAPVLYTLRLITPQIHRAGALQSAPTTRLPPT